MAHNNGSGFRPVRSGLAEASAQFRGPGVTAAVAPAAALTGAEMTAFVPHRPARPEKSEGGKTFRLVSEYEPAGDQPTAIKELISANIFPGDMLYKNFGVTRNGRVVFYDYDEIESLTDCIVRRVPQPRNEEDEMSSEPWYAVGAHDIFPETYTTFLLGDARVHRYFMQHHPDFFEPALWQRHKDHILNGEVAEFFPYETTIRFCQRYPALFDADRATHSPINLASEAHSHRVAHGASTRPEAHAAPAGNAA